MPQDVITKTRSLENVLAHRATVGISGRTGQSTDIYTPSGEHPFVFTDSEISGIETRYTNKWDDPMDMYAI